MERSPLLENLIKTGQHVGPTVGKSMEPMLRERRDSVVIKRKDERLKKWDVAFYVVAGRFILHRVIKVTDTGYIIRGDNCYADEVVPENAVFGVLTEFFREDKHYYCTDKEYLKYVKRHVHSYPFRKFWMKLKSFGGRVIRKLKGRK